MVTMLECIERIPTLLQEIIDNRIANFAKVIAAVGEREIDEIVLIGSGTSNTSAVTARPLVEKTSGLRVTVRTADEFYYDSHYRNPHALYLFTSQTGTSKVVREAQKAITSAGLLTACMSEHSNTPLASETPLFICMGCGNEEYPMRTIGYTTSVFTLMLLGVELGRAGGHLAEPDYQHYLEQAALLPQSHADTTVRTLKWLQHSRRQMMRSQSMIFTGAECMYGVALEGAMKVWETPQIMSMGYELEEGMHGPNYGYNQNHCVIVLVGPSRSDKALSLAGYVKNGLGNGFAVGSPVLDDRDLLLDLRTTDFCCIEVAPVVQVISYQLAVDGGRDLFAPHDNSKMEAYFKTHA